MASRELEREARSLGEPEQDHARWRDRLFDPRQQGFHDVQRRAEERLVGFQRCGERIRVPRISGCLRCEVCEAGPDHLGRDGHDVLGGRPATVHKDHRGARFAEPIPRFDHGHTFMWSGHRVRSMTTP